MTTAKKENTRGDDQQSDEDVPTPVEVSDAELETGDARARDLERGYEKRNLADGSIDYLCLYDQWTSRDEGVMKEHIAAYQMAMRQRGVV